MSRFRLFLALSACALLALPAVAGARPGQRGFNHTFPVASGLCAKVANGHTPKRLAGQTDKVAAACATLKTSFTDAQNAYSTAVAPLKQQATDAIKALRATCKEARANHNAAACKAARQSTRATLKDLRAQVRTAGKTYHASVQAARKAFWSTIKSLRGGSSITPDKTVGSDPTTSLPSDAAVVTA
jgi:hypothetical protein